MATLSTAAFVLHDLGLASSVGGTLFGRAAFHPAVEPMRDRQERDEVVERAWRNFSIVNGMGHLAMAVPWFVGRRIFSGREAGRHARGMTIAKDVLVGASLASGLSSMILGRALGRRVRRGEGPARANEPEVAVARRSRQLEQVVGVLGSVNLACNAGLIVLTSLLAMQSSRSSRFPLFRRRLP